MIATFPHQPEFAPAKAAAPAAAISVMCVVRCPYQHDCVVWVLALRRAHALLQFVHSFDKGIDKVGDKEDRRFWSRRSNYSSFRYGSSSQFCWGQRKVFTLPS